MPTFVFTDPSGKTHEVTGPPGATQEQAFKMLQQRMGGGAGAPAAPKAPEYDPTEGMGWGEKALANIGAGMHSAWTGAKQLVGQGPSDEELQEKRRIDKQLAERTTGGSLLQTVGEIAPTIPLGLGAGMGARALGGIAAEVAASPTLSSMGGGALSGAVMPTTSDESRLQNIGFGAAGGGVAPHVLKLALAGGRGASNLAQRAAAAIPEDLPIVGQIGARAAVGGGERKAGEVLKKALPGGVPADVYTPHPHIGGPGPSAAVATQSPELAVLEQASRTKAGQEWMPFEQGQHEARWKALDEGLLNEADLAQRMEATGKVGEQVGTMYGTNVIQPKRFNAAMDDFYAQLQDAKTSAAYHGTPAVKNAVDYIENAMEGAGTVTPELLHKIRQTVSKGLQGAPGIGDQATRAAASEPYVIGLTQAMDDVLNTGSRGRWNNWKSDYANAKMREEAAKADVNIRGKFIDPNTGTPLKPVTGLEDVPVLKPQALKQAIAQAGTMKRGLRKGQNVLSPASEDILTGVRRDLDAGEILSRYRGAATGGGGSNTAANLTNAMVMEYIMPTGIPAMRYLAKEGGRNIEQAAQKKLAELLQSPAKLRAFIATQTQQRALRGGAPNVPGLGLSMPLLTGPDQ